MRRTLFITSALALHVFSGPFLLNFLTSAAVADNKLIPPAVKPLTVNTRSALAARARLQDADTLLNLVAEGGALYRSDELKLNGYQYCNQAISLAEKGEFRYSIQSASKALYLAQKNKNGQLEALAKRDLAIVYNYVKLLDKAEDFAKEALARSDNTPQFAEQIKAPAYKVLGDVEAQKHHYDKAIQQYEQALSFSSERYRPFVQISLINARIASRNLTQARQELDAMPVLKDPSQQAQLQRTRAELLLAEQKPQEALELYQHIAEHPIGDETDYYHMWALEGLARSQLALNQKAEAAATLKRTVAASDQVRAHFHSEEFKMGLFSDLQSIFEQAIALNMELGKPSDALETSERSRSRALLDAVHSRKALPDFATQTLSLPALQSALNADERVIVFHSLPQQLLAWVISRESIRPVSYPLTRSDSNQLVDAFRSAIIEGKTTVQAGADQLGKLLLQPLDLQAGQRLIIIPHGALHYLPFQALRLHEHYLIEQHPVSVAPSLSIAVQLAARKSLQAGRLAAFGNPDIAPQYALPGAEQEVKQLAAFFPEKKLFLHADATKSQLKQTIDSANILHVAAHAQVDQADPLHSRILLANENGKQSFFEAHEVLDLNLNQVGLVTLSACESGLGKIEKGDEVLGFPRSFLSSGTSALIASLWPVSDEASALLMTTLYHQLAQHKDIQQAMQAGQLAVLHQPQTAHPFFWAPFNLMGNWRLTIGSSL